MNALRTAIRQRLSQPLPGAKSHYKMIPPGRRLKAPSAHEAHVKHSSVLVLLFQENSELRVCLIKRPSFMKHHAGQIALPGGRMEAGESPEQTALRETYEEIGVVSESIQILGRLSGFYVEVSNFQVHPVVGWLHKKPTFRLCEQEVEKLLCFPIQRFKPPYETIRLKTLTGTLTVPCVHYQNEIIWGATAMILAEFYDVLQECLPDKS